MLMRLIRAGRTSFGAAALCAALASPAAAQAIHGDVSYDVDAYGASDEFTVGSYGDPIFGHRHYTAVNGEGVVAVSGSNYSIESPLTFDGSGGWTSTVRRGNLRIAIAGVVENPTDGDGLGAALATFTLTNVSGSPMTVRHFVFADLDINGSGGDIGTFFGSAPGRIEQGDGQVFSFGSTATYSRWMLDTYSDVSSLLNGGGTNLDLPNSSSPAGPGDLELALQYTFTIAAGASVAHTVRFECLSGITCDGGSELLPDMEIVASYLSDRSYDTSTIPGRRLLRLSTGTGNKGVGPMEIRGGASYPDGTQDVWQVVHKTDGCTSEYLAGKFVYHPSHGHVHFEGWGQYRLRSVLPGGGVGDVVAEGGKTSFCLLDISHYNPTLPGSPSSGSYGGCGVTRQGISVGWADVYSKSLPDQWIDITDLPPCTYWLEAEVDPENSVVELDETNNAARVLVDLDTTSGDEVFTRYGNVDTGAGGSGNPAIVLTVGGESGDTCRREFSRAAGPTTIEVAPSPGGGTVYAIWVMNGAPTGATVGEAFVKTNSGPESLGLASRCLPVTNTAFPASCGSPGTFSLGFTSKNITGAAAAASVFLPRMGASPAAPASLPIVFPAGTFTVQGIIADPNSPNSPKKLSLTNAVVVTVTP